MKQILFIMIGLSTILIADFSRSGDIVIDNITKLQWQDDIGAKSEKLTWIKAINYCESLTLGNHDDWRLPNINELHYLSNRSKSNPAIDSTFVNVVSDRYWSSTTSAGVKKKNSRTEYGETWYVNFYYGSDYYDERYNKHYVRCVRDNY